MLHPIDHFPISQLIPLASLLFLHLFLLHPFIYYSLTITISYLFQPTTAPPSPSLNPSLNQGYQYTLTIPFSLSYFYSHIKLNIHFYFHYPHVSNLCFISSHLLRYLDLLALNLKPFISFIQKFEWLIIINFNHSFKYNLYCDFKCNLQYNFDERMQNLKSLL